MLDDLLKLVMRATSVAPSYRKDLCLAVTQSRSACSTCVEICPHDAVSITRAVEIDEIDCSGCGLCVRGCPSQALAATVTYQPGAPLRCSKVAGNAQSIHCLGRLTPSDLLRLAGSKGKTTLAHGDCASCPIGSAAVKLAIDELVERATALAEARGSSITIEVLQAERFDAHDAPDRISRRQLLRGGVRNVQRTAAELLAPLDPGEEDDTLPSEMQRQYRMLELADLAPGTPVPWPLPRVAEGCIMCPVCTKVCPTNAFSRNFELDDRPGAALLLEPERCMGCNACVTACPVKVITLDQEIAWGELSGGRQEAYYKDPGATPAGSVAR